MATAQQLLVVLTTFTASFRVSLDHLYPSYKPLLVEPEQLEEQLQATKKGYLYPTIPQTINLGISVIHFQKQSRLSELKKNYLHQVIVQLAMTMSHLFTLIQIRKLRKLLLILQVFKFLETQLPTICLLELIA